MGSALTCPTPRVCFSYLLYNTPSPTILPRSVTETVGVRTTPGNSFCIFVTPHNHLGIIILHSTSPIFNFKIIYHPLKLHKMSSAACIFCKIIKGMSHHLYHDILYLHISIAMSDATRSKIWIDWRASLGHIGDIPSLKLFESDKVFAFLDIQPLSLGHAVRIIPYDSIPLPRIPTYPSWRGVSEVPRTAVIASTSNSRPIIQKKEK